MKFDLIKISTNHLQPGERVRLQHRGQQVSKGCPRCAVLLLWQ